jgi:hypothetical protein
MHGRRFICVNHGRCAAAAQAPATPATAPGICPECGEPLVPVARGSLDVKVLAGIGLMACLSVCVLFYGLRWRFAAAPSSSVGGMSFAASFENSARVPVGRYFTDPRTAEVMRLATQQDQAALARFSQSHPGLLTSRGRGGITLAHLALLQKDAAAFATLLAAGGDKHAAADNGISPLMAAAMLPDARFLQAALAGGARLEQQDLLGRTALHLAVLQRQVANVRLLLSAGANPNQPDAHGCTPWLVAFQGRRPNREITVLLRGHGASNDRKDQSGLTARDYAAAFDDPDLLKLLQ